MEEQQYLWEVNMSNPIKKIDGQTIKPPSVYVWEEEDASAHNAGRTEDVVMHKRRVGQVVALQLGWNALTTAEASDILTKFNPEYVVLEYKDPKAGGFLTKEFYIGNRSAPSYNAALDIWDNVSFKAVARRG